MGVQVSSSKRKCGNREGSQGETLGAGGVGIQKGMDVETVGYFSVEIFGVNTPRPMCVYVFRNGWGMHTISCLYP